MKRIILFIGILLSCYLVGFSQNDSLKTYHHAVLGFSITYPKSWSTISVDEYYNHLNTINLTTTEFNELLVKNARVPFFAITKFQEPYTDLNPSIKINTRPYGASKGQSLDVILNMISGQFQKMFVDFSIVQAPTKMALGNQSCWYMRMNYALKAPDGKVYPTCSELYLIDKVDYFYMIGVGTRQDEKNGRRSEIRNMLNSLYIK